MRKPLVMFAAAAAVALLASPAVAQADKPVDTKITVSNTSPTVGESVRVQVPGFDPMTFVRVKVEALGGSRPAGAKVSIAATDTCAEGAVCSVRATGAGVAQTKVTVVTAGHVQLTFSGADADGRRVSRVVGLAAKPQAVVAVDSGSDVPEVPGVLSETGSETSRGSLTGLLLVLVGAIAFYVARYRGRHRLVFAGRHRRV